MTTKKNKVNSTSVKSVADICTERLEKTLSENKLYFKNKLQTVNNWKNLENIKIYLTVEQHSDNYMIYNKTFSGFQKNEGGIPYITDLCWNRSLFGKNDIQSFKTPEDFIASEIGFRGGITTKSKDENKSKSKNESKSKEANTSLERTFLSYIEIFDYDQREDDQLGITAKSSDENADKQSTNHLSHVTKYKNAKCSVVHTFSITSYIKQIKGTHDNPLEITWKNVHERHNWTDAQSFKMAEHLVPLTEDGYFNINELIRRIEKKYENFVFKKGGVDAEFKVTHCKISDISVKNRTIPWLEIK